MNLQINYILNAYGHLIPFSKRMTAKEFLTALKTSYSLDNSRNRQTYDAIESAQDKIEYFEHDIRGIKSVKFINA